MASKLPSPRDHRSVSFGLRPSTPPSGAAPRGRAGTADRLAAQGAISADDAYRAVVYARSQRQWIEDALIDLGIMSEAELLRDISILHVTRFVSTPQLARLAVAPQLLRRVTVKAAEQYTAFPVLWDEATRTLTVVMGDPGDEQALQDLRVAGDARRVVALVARPGAVRAAIARHYHGDAFAFRSVLGTPGAFDLAR